MSCWFNSKNSISIAILCFLFFPIVLSGNSRDEIDLLEYAEKAVLVAEGIEGKSWLFKEIGEAYLQFGSVEKAMALVDLIDEEYYKTSLLIEIIHCPHAIQSDFVKTISQKYMEFEEESFKADIWYNLVSYYLERKDRANVKKSLIEFKKLIYLDDSFSSWERLMELPGLLIENGLKSEADNIVRGYLKLIEKNEVGLSSQMSVLKTLYRQGMIGDFPQLIKRIQVGVDSRSSAEDRAIYCNWFAETLFEFDRLEEGYNYLRKSIGHANRIKPLEKRKLFIYREWIQPQRFDPGRKGMIPRLDEFETLLRDLCAEEGGVLGDESSEISRSFVEAYITLLINKGKIKIPREVANRNPGLMDFFNYRVALNFLDNQPLRHKALHFSKKIKSSPHLKIDVMLKYRERLGNLPFPGTYFILDEALQEAKRMANNRDEHLYKIAMAYLDIGDVQKADELYFQIKNSDARSHLAFHVIQVCLRNYSLAVAQKQLDKYTGISSEFRALCLSKIASRLFLEGKVERSFKMYKAAVDCMLKFYTPQMSGIFRDYYYAIEKGRMVFEKREFHN
jgi:tetratricopeptide (TPR) repeat protein